MMTQKEISGLLQQPLYGNDGHKIGKATRVFYDDVTGRPDWVTVKTGMFGSSESFVPVHDAVATEGHLKVPYSRDKIKAAPGVDVSAEGHLSVTEERRLYGFYGVDGDALLRRRAQERPAEERGPGQQESMDREAAADQRVKDRGTAADQRVKDRGTAADQRTMDESAAMDQRAMDRSAAMDERAAMDRGTAADQPAMGEAAPASQGLVAGQQADMGGAQGAAGATDEVMTRSEEQMHVGVERHATSRVRLHRVVETEEQQLTVPVRREEVRLVREPITDANRAEAMAEPELSEAERVVTLHEEKPVVETTVEAKERVRLAVDERTEEQTVRGTVRKEQIRLEEDKD